MLKTATIVAKFACKFLSFSHFLKRFFYHSVILFFVFSFSLLSFNSSIYSSSTFSKRDAIVTEKTKLFLGNLRANRERVILPTSQSKIKKTHFLYCLINIPKFCPLCYYIHNTKQPLIQVLTD